MPTKGDSLALVIFDKEGRPCICAHSGWVVPHSSDYTTQEIIGEDIGSDIMYTFAKNEVSRIVICSIEDAVALCHQLDFFPDMSLFT